MPKEGSGPMGRSVFLAALALVAGVCLGVVAAVCLQPEGVPPGEESALFSAMNASAPAQAVGSPLPGEGAEQTPPGENQALLDQAFSVLTALAERDWRALAGQVHPMDGVVFTPYSTVDLSANLCFSAGQVAEFGGDAARYVWGLSDGAGEPLELTVEEYFARYVWNTDYRRAPMLGVDRVIGSGNCLENVSEIFPEGRFVEFYFPGLEPEYNGFDWCALKLVFTEYQGAYRLRAVIHSEWTI